MPKFELLDEKAQPQALKEGDHIMLMLAYHTHLNPTGYKFHQLVTNGPRFEVFRPIE